MKIRRIAAYRVDLPLHEGSYKWSGGKSVGVFDSTIVEVEADDGTVGHGEVCPLGSAYLPSYAAGVRAGVAELAPQLIGADPTQLGKLNRRMDSAMKGHPYVKSGIDIACWDILGKVAGMPVCHLLGRSLRRGFRPLPGDLAAVAGGDGGERRRLPGPKATASSSSRWGGDPDTDIARIKAVAAVLEPGDRLVADAQYRLADARGRPGSVRGVSRRRRVYRAALSRLRGMPGDPPSDRSPVRHGTNRSTASRPCSGGFGDGRDGRREPQDQQVRRPEPRSVRPATSASRWGSP